LPRAASCLQESPLGSPLGANDTVDSLPPLLPDRDSTTWPSMPGPSARGDLGMANVERRAVAILTCGIDTEVQPSPLRIGRPRSPPRWASRRTGSNQIRTGLFQSDSSGRGSGRGGWSGSKGPGGSGGSGGCGQGGPVGSNHVARQPDGGVIGRPGSWPGERRRGSGSSPGSTPASRTGGRCRTGGGSPPSRFAETSSARAPSQCTVLPRHDR
jgi:hypothetical protein